MPRNPLEFQQSHNSTLSGAVRRDHCASFSATTRGVFLELRQLRYFIGVSEAGRLLKAAARLHIAQPALGQQIAALKDELGARLFERSSRGMTLTEPGAVPFGDARLVLADAERARHAVRETSALPSGEVAIGLPAAVALAVTVPMLSRCRERFPSLRLKVIDAHSGFLREWLPAGRLDLALLFGDAADASLPKLPPAGGAVGVRHQHSQQACTSQPHVGRGGALAVGATGA